MRIPAGIRMAVLLAVLSLLTAGCASLARDEGGYVMLDAKSANVRLWSNEKLRCIATSAGTSICPNAYAKGTLCEPCVLEFVNGTKVSVDGAVTINGQKYTGTDPYPLSIFIMADGRVVTGATAKWEK